MRNAVSALAKIARGEDVWDVKTLAAAQKAGAAALIEAFEGTLVEPNREPKPAKDAREAYRWALARLLARSPAGIEHLLDTAKTARDVNVRGLGLAALFVNQSGNSVEPHIPKRPILEQIVGAHDLRRWNGDKAYAELYRWAALALFWFDPALAYEVGQELLSARSLASKEGRARAEALFIGVPKRTEDGWPLPKFDKRWPALLAPLVKNKKLEYSVLFFLHALPPDPVVIEPLLARLGKNPDKVTYFDDASIRVLGRVADARVVPYLVAALRASWMHFPAVFEGFERAGDPAMAHVIREWLKENGSKERNALGNAVIAKLEKRGKAPKPAKPALAKPPKPPKKRTTYAFKKGPKHKPLKLPPLAEQRAAIVSWLASIGFDGRASAVITPCCVLDAVRVDDTTLAVGATKIAGLPDLPADTPWPRTGTQPLVFLAQIDLAEAAPHLPKGALPKSGLLSFFVADDPEREYLTRAQVIYTKPKAKLVRLALPDDYTERVYQACRVTLHPYLKVPAFDDPLIRGLKLSGENWVGPAEGAFQLLGSRDHGYNGSLADDARLLFQCPSASQAQMELGDLDILGIFLPAKSLAKHDFAAAYPYVGD